jgi:hypothetical protein
MRGLGLLRLLGLVLALVGCDETPSGPTVNNSGDHANICIGARDAGCTTPAPVVVPPTVVPPVITGGGE